MGEHTGEVEQATVFALVHQITEQARQTAYLHQENQISDEFLMIIMSASQLKSDPKSIAQEISALTEDGEESKGRSP